MVHLTFVGVTKSAVILKLWVLRGSASFELSKGGTMGDQVVPVTVVRKSHLLIEAVACGEETL